MSTLGAPSAPSWCGFRAQRSIGGVTHSDRLSHDTHLSKRRIRPRLSDREPRPWRGRLDDGRPGGGANRRLHATATGLGTLRAARTRCPRHGQQRGRPRRVAGRRGWIDEQLSRLQSVQHAADDRQHGGGHPRNRGLGKRLPCLLIVGRRVLGDSGDALPAEHVGDHAALRAGNVSPPAAFLAVVDQSSWCAPSATGVPCYVNAMEVTPGSLALDVPASSALDVYGNVNTDLAVVPASHHHGDGRPAGLGSTRSGTGGRGEPGIRRP